MISTKFVWVKICIEIIPEEIEEESLYSPVRHFQIQAWHCIPKAHYSIEVIVSCFVQSGEIV